MELIFATANPHKVGEASQIIATQSISTNRAITLIMPKELGMVEEIPETGSTIEENSLIKSRYIWNRLGRDCFADDTALEVDALGGAPGVYSARYAGEGKDFKANIEKLLSELKRVQSQSATPISRTARFRTVISLILDGKVHTFEGVMEGTIAEQESGTNGFGYDPIFIPQGYNITLAQMSSEEKNAISHRGIAMRKLGEFLAKLPAAK
ncbi:MAG: RdgB/HAM1 family non-canonical purine NTP pyrophosphatase [Bacteroidales bacterium]|nr:RdgB/HAM1 family non-canonical purine NTP pyrophosphatase [Bacteroidales bacterium]